MALMKKPSVKAQEKNVSKYHFSFQTPFKKHLPNKTSKPTFKTNSFSIHLAPNFLLGNQPNHSLFPKKKETTRSASLSRAPASPFKGCSPMAVAPPVVLKGLWAMQAKSASGVCSGPTPQIDPSRRRESAVRWVGWGFSLGEVREVV